MSNRITVVWLFLLSLTFAGSLPAQEAAAPAEVPTVVPTAVPAEKTPTDEAESPEQKPVRKKGVRPAARLRARLPKDLFGEDLPESPDPAATVLGGTVPAIWEIERSDPNQDDENLPIIVERDSLAPPVPPKVIRYAEWLMRHYDTNADGVLQSEEWKKMPGAPQAIDIDGDTQITLDEMVRHMALYGQERTIHRPVPVQRYHQPRLSADYQLFKPVSPPPPPKPEPSVPKVEDGAESENGENTEKKTSEGADDPSIDMTEEAMAADEQPLDDETYEEIIAGRQVPAEKKFDTPRELYKGLPAWFFFRDRDGDGQVSLVEFAPTLNPRALALFGKLDKNGDGFITPEEVRVPTQAAPTAAPAVEESP